MTTETSAADKVLSFMSSEVGLIVQLSSLVASAVPPLIERIKNWKVQTTEAQREAVAQLQASLANVQVALSTLDTHLADVAKDSDARIARIPSEGK